MARLSTMVALLLFAVAGCGGGNPAPAQASPAGPIQVRMVQPVDGFAFEAIYTAIQQGYFKDDNIQVDFTVAGAGGREISAIVAGQADIAVSSGVELGKAAAQGADLVGVCTVYDRAEVGLALAPQVAKRLNFSESMTLKQRFALLKGLKIGITAPGTLTDVMARYYVTAAGLNPSTDVQIVAVGPGAQGIAALQKGSIDAFVPFPPFTQLITQGGSGVVVFDPTTAQTKDPILDQWLEEAIVVTKSYAKEHASDLRRVLSALKKANKWINQHSDQELSDLLGTLPWAASIDPTTRLAAVKALAGGVPSDGIVKVEQLNNVTQTLQKIGFTSKPINGKDYVDNSYLQ